jgi:cholesterol oxidase
MKDTYLKHLSSRIGEGIRTNNESLSLIHSRRRNTDFSKGVAIGSIFAPDEHSHVESVRYGSGSGFWKLMGVPLVQGKSVAERSIKLIWKLISRPRDVFRSLTSKDFAKESAILLFMQHLDSTLKFKKGFLSMRSKLSTGPAPTADMPLARRLTKATAREIDGTPFIMFTEAVLGTPLTAHILGGCSMGKDAAESVLDANQRVHGYANLYVCDGSAISANPGVNPALTITAMTERVMSKIPENKKVTK